MTMENKSGDVIAIKSLNDGGVIEGYGSTFGGDPDSYGDIVEKGAFKTSLSDFAASGKTVKMLWQHNTHEPIGSWTAINEDDHGLFLKGQINMDTQRGRETHSLLKSGALDGLSVGYRVKNSSYDEDTDIRTLLEVVLYEVSIVTIGANENATVTSVKHTDAAKELLNRLKAGDQLQKRGLETLFKSYFGFSNLQAERAVRLHLKEQGVPVDAAKIAFLRALKQ